MCFSCNDPGSVRPAGPHTGWTARLGQVDPSAFDSETVRFRIDHARTVDARRSLTAGSTKAARYSWGRAARGPGTQQSVHEAAREDGYQQGSVAGRLPSH